jgi:alcohol dehydrogenase
MAEAFLLPTSCLHIVPDSIPDEVAVFVEPLAAALEIVQQLHLRPTERAAVVGDGKLGALIVQVLRLTGCELTLFGHHPERWLLFQQQGIDCLHSSEQPDSLFDLVVDCTGQPAGLDMARQLVRPRGRLVLKSTFHGQTDLNLSMIVVDEIYMIGSRCGPFAAALRLLERGLVKTAPLISGRFALADGLAAFDAARGSLKVLLEVGAQER